MFNKLRVLIPKHHHTRLGGLLESAISPRATMVTISVDKTKSAHRHHRVGMICFDLINTRGGRLVAFASPRAKVDHPLVTEFYRAGRLRGPGCSLRPLIHALCTICTTHPFSSCAAQLRR